MRDPLPGGHCFPQESEVWVCRGVIADGTFATIPHRIRKYPYWARRSDVVIVGALFLVAFLEGRGRPYWFLWGIVSGAALVGLLGKWHLFPMR